MFLRESRHKRAGGEEVVYLQLAESVWDPATGRPKTRIVYSFGRASDAGVREELRKLARGILRRVAPEEMVAENPSWKVVDAWPFGDVYALEHLWSKVGLKKLLPSLTKDGARSKLPVERACFAMVANRCCAPASKLYLFEQWLREDVRVDEAQGLELHHLYRAMDFFEMHKDAVEKELFFEMADLFSCDVDLVFYDTTTLHCEIDAEDAGGADDVKLRGSKLSGAKEYEALRQRGKSKNKRNDVPQIVVGLAMTRDGLPIRSWVFRGDTVDVETVAQVKADLKSWKLSRSIFVGDAGMVSKANLKALSKGGGKYILCMPMRRGDEVTEAVLGRAGRFRKLSENLFVKEVWVGEGERRRRYAVCFNPAEAKRQRAHRAQIIAELEELLPRLAHPTEDRQTHSRRKCELRASERYGKYIYSGEHGRLLINRHKVRQEKRTDGKFVVHSNDDSLTPDDLALGYKQQATVERGFRLLKNGIRVRPMFHWAPHRICAHVSLTMIALLLERLAENACGDTWRNIRDDLRQVKLVQLLTPQGAVWQVTEPGRAAANRLKQLGIPPPPTVLRIEKAPSHTPSLA
jgi:hypothetical protein